MARIRTIKPKFFQHEQLFEAEENSGLPLRLAYVGLWTQCDREGRFEWRPRQLKLNILPYDNCDFSAVLSALESFGFVKRYVEEREDARTVARATPGLDVEAFERWETYRSVELRKPLGEMSLPAAAKALAKFGENQAAVVERSIGNRWQGLFELKDGASRGTPKTKFSQAIENLNRA